VLHGHSAQDHGGGTNAATRTGDNDNPAIEPFCDVLDPYDKYAAW
jgi:hypothetical protein